MKKFRIIVASFLFALMCAMAVHGLSGLVANAEESNASDAARALFEKKCSICHSLTRPLSKHKDQKEWTETVQRMRERSGEWIAEQEAKIIVDYLVMIRGKKELSMAVPSFPPPLPGGDDHATALFEKKCSICHSLTRPLSKHKDQKEWTETVKRMQERSGSWISDPEAETIIDYLVRVRGRASLPMGKPVAAGAPSPETLAMEKGIFEKKCSICHLLDRPLTKNKDRKGWMETVGKMKDRSGQWISEDDSKAIVEYLSTIRGK